MKERQLGCCGLDCGVCPVFIATANNDASLRIQTARTWSKLYAEYLGGDTLKPEAMNCGGCQSKGEVFVGCTNCPIRKCCREKDLTTCARCVERETCGMLAGFLSVPSHEQAKQNLDSVRKNG